jgi:hypothetical protein
MISETVESQGSTELQFYHDDTNNCSIKKGKYFIIVKGKSIITIDKRNFKCPHCKKLFKEKGNLRTHIRVHVNSFSNNL